MSHMQLPGKTLIAGQSVGLSVLENKVAVVTFDAAGSKVNLLSSSVMAELSAIVDRLEVSGAFSGVVFRSGKSNVFIAGADISEIEMARTLPSEVAFKGCQDGKKLLNRIRALPFKKVAAIHGRCLGGGAELTLVCNERIASDSEMTVIGLPEVGLGVLPGWGGTIRATKMIGFANALPLILNPLKPFSAKRAWRTGLVSEVVSEDKLFARAVEVASVDFDPKKVKRYKPSLVENLTRFLTDSAPGRFIVAKIATKRVTKETGGKYPAPYRAIGVMQAALSQSAFKAYELESRTFAELCHTPECGECVKMFREHQAKKKSGAQ